MDVVNLDNLGTIRFNQCEPVHTGTDGRAAHGSHGLLVQDSQGQRTGLVPPY